MTPRYNIHATLQSRQLSLMLKMQAEMNSAVNKEWASAGYRWTRAIMVEGVEMMEHYNCWKWWKKNTTPDMPQVRLELVDIFHFALSEWMVRFGSTDHTDWVLNEAIMRRVEAGETFAANLDTSHASFNSFSDRLIGAAANGLIDHEAFFALCHICGLTWDELFKGYVGKNTLNLFRQKYGYKTGHYLKNWGDKEDNVVLDEVLAEIPASVKPEEAPTAVFAALFERYKAACQQDSVGVIEKEEGPLLVKKSGDTWVTLTGQPASAPQKMLPI